MERICPRCKNTLQDNDFLCPYCGAIYGEPAYPSAPVPKPAEDPVPPAAAPEVPPPARKRSWMPLILIAVFLLLGLVLFFYDPFAPDATLSSTPPLTSLYPTTTLPPVPTQPPTEASLDRMIVEAYNLKYCQGQLDDSVVKVLPYMNTNDFIVVLLKGMDAQYPKDAVEVIEQCKFYYAPGCRLAVYADGKVYSLTKAYGSVLNNSQILALRDAYQIRNSQLYTPEDIAPPKLKLSAAELDALQSSLPDSYTASDLRVYYWSSDLSVVGIYAGFDGYQSEVSVESVGDVAFLTSVERLQVIQDGRGMSLAEAYGKGILSHDVLHKVYESYRQHHLLLYYSYSSIPQELVRLQLLNEYNFAVHKNKLDVSDLSVEIYHDFLGAPAVIYIDGDPYYEEISTMDLVEGRIFHYDTRQKMLLYHNGQFIRLQSAIDYGLLHPDVIESVHSKHIQRHPELYTPEETDIRMPQVDESVLQQIRSDYAQISGMPSGASVDDVSVTIYGCFGDTYVGCFSAPWDLNCGEPELYMIGDMVIASQSYIPLQVYCRGQFMSLQYAMGLLGPSSEPYLNIGQLKEIYPLFVQENLDQYYPEELLPESFRQRMILERFNNQYFNGAYDIGDLTFRSYGIYNDARVFMVDGTDAYENRLTQDYHHDLVLHYPTTQQMTVFKDGRFYTIAEALDAYVLTRTDYIQLVSEYSTQHPERYQMPLPLTKLPSMDQDRLFELASTLRQQGGWEIPPGGQIGNVKLQYYMDCEKGQVFYAFNLIQNAAGVLQCDRIGDLIFLHLYGTDFYVYVNGSFLSIRKAYDAGILSQEEWYRLHELYVSRNRYWYSSGQSMQVDWDSIDWANVDPAILGKDTYNSWEAWLISDATLEQLIQVAHIRMDGAYTAGYCYALGKYFVNDPVKTIAEIANADPQLHDTLMLYILFSEYFETAQLDKREFILAIQLPEDATDMERSVLQKLINEITASQLPT